MQDPTTTAPEREELIAMAVAAVAEELKTDVTRIRVLSFREVAPTPLTQYLEDHHLAFRKYELKDELA